MTIPNVAAQFDGIANTIVQASPLLAGATITIDALYGLDASDLKPPGEDTQFFCGGPDLRCISRSPFPSFRQGQWALTLVHATGVKQPQQMAFLLQRNGGWQLAGFFVKPLTVAGHDSLWYWTQARVFTQKGQKWNAYFYYETALYLATPADFLTSPNLEKLNQEANAVKPAGLPGERRWSLQMAVRPIPSATYTQTVRSAGWIWLCAMPPRIRAIRSPPEPRMWG